MEVPNVQNSPLRRVCGRIREGIPDLVLVLEETVRFEGDRIVSLEDRYTAEMVAEIERFVAEYGPKLGLDLRSR